MSWVTISIFVNGWTNYYLGDLNLHSRDKVSYPNKLIYMNIVLYFWIRSSYLLISLSYPADQTIYLWKWGLLENSSQVQKRLTPLKEKNFTQKKNMEKSLVFSLIMPFYLQLGYLYLMHIMIYLSLWP